MARKEDWPERFHEALLERSEHSFTWGETDCLMTVCTFLEVITGVNPGSAYRGQYTTEAGALRIIRAGGCSSMEELVSQLAAAQGYAEISPRLAQRGDLIALDGPEGTAFGVVSLNGREAIFAALDGLRSPGSRGAESLESEVTRWQKLSKARRSLPEPF